MKVYRGKEGRREWTEYGFRLNHKNHAIIIQRTLKDDCSNPWWYTYYLEGRGKDDPVSTMKEAPLSRIRAEKYARNYIKNLLKGVPIE